MDKSTIKRIEDFMKAKDLTKAKLSRALGIDAQRLGYYLRGERNPKGDFFVKWERAFGESLDPVKSQVQNKEHEHALEKLNSKIAAHETTIRLQQELIDSLKAQIRSLENQAKSLKKTT